MSTTIDRDKVNADPIEIIKVEIKKSRDEHRAISRQLLAELVALRTGMKTDEAWLLVDSYCEENEAAIPGYLRHEFNMHWPKVTAVLLALAGIGILWFGGTASRGHWLWYSLGTVVFGLGALIFVRNMESYQKFIRERREQLKG